jgi:hypothetical protein
MAGGRPTGQMQHSTGQYDDLARLRQVRLEKAASKGGCRAASASLACSRQVKCCRPRCWGLWYFFTANPVESLDPVGEPLAGRSRRRGAPQGRYSIRPGRIVRRVIGWPSWAYRRAATHRPVVDSQARKPAERGLEDLLARRYEPPPLILPREVAPDNRSLFIDAMADPLRRESLSTSWRETVVSDLQRVKTA